MLHAVLNLLHGNLSVFHLPLKIRRHTEGKKLQDFTVIILLCGLKGFLNGFCNFA